MKKEYYLLCVFIIMTSVMNREVHGQATTAIGSNLPGGAGDYLGWATGSAMTDLTVQTIDGIPINFYANSSSFPSPLMTLHHSQMVGIGKPVPVWKLDVAGDINIDVPSNGLRLNNTTMGFGAYFLRNNDIASNIYLGYNTGNTNPTEENVFIGLNAGQVAVNGTGHDGGHNTFVGHVSGANNTSGRQNSFYGDSAGYNTATGYHNTFIGARSGFGNIGSISSTYIGYEAGNGNGGSFNVMTGRATGKFAQGSQNCYYGKDVAQIMNGDGNAYYGSHAGDDSPTSSYNSVFGYDAGRFFEGERNCFYGVASALGGPATITGDYNAFYGPETNFTGTVTDLNYTGAFGWNARPASDNMIIIGANITPYPLLQPIHVGIGLSEDTWAGGPRSQLEINSNTMQTMPDYAGSTGSGLQFRQMNPTVPRSVTAAWEPAWGGVLTVDVDGKVKLTESYGLAGCSGTIAPPSLPSNVGLAMANQKIYYSGNGQASPFSGMNNAIGIGYNCSANLPAKLSVNQTFTAASVEVNTMAGFFHNGDFTNCPPLDVTKFGIVASCDGLSTQGGCHVNLTNVGGRFDASNAEQFNTGVVGTGFSVSEINIGGDFEAEEANQTNIGVRGISTWFNNYNNEGGFFEASNGSNDNIGVSGITTGGGAGVNIGVYGTAPTATCTTGVGNCPGGAAGYFDGDVYATGNNYITSDLNLKDNINPLENAMMVINALHPKTYTFRRGINKNLQLADGIQGGIVAQELKNVLPNLVHEFKVPVIPDSTGAYDSTGLAPSYLAVNYTGLIPYLIGAAKEQQHYMDSLAGLISNLQQQLQNCCNSSSGSRLSNPAINVELSNSIILNENDPNPFAEETRISFNIPESVHDAKIIFSDNSNHIIQTVKINERGEGQLNVYSSNLSSGIYTYTLIADGKSVDSKRMVCAK